MKRNPVVPSLFAPNIEEAIAYYVDVLGFKETGNWKEDGKCIWAEVALGPSVLWFFARAIDGRPKPVMSGLIYIFVEDVDAVVEMLSGRVAFRWGPEDQPYGLREVGVEDLNGYLIVFAQDI